MVTFAVPPFVTVSVPGVTNVVRLPSAKVASMPYVPVGTPPTDAVPPSAIAAGRLKSRANVTGSRNSTLTTAPPPPPAAFVTETWPVGGAGPPPPPPPPPPQATETRSATHARGRARRVVSMVASSLRGHGEGDEVAGFVAERAARVLARPQL